MRRAILIAVACLGVWVPSARAVDWNIKSSFTETLEFNDNRAMRTNPAGNSYNSVSALMFDAHALTPTTRLDLKGGLTYRAYSGPGEAGTVNALDNNVSARFEKTTKLTTYNLTASRSERETATLQLEETGLATLTGSTIVETLGGGFKHRLGPRDTVASQTTWSSTSFTESNGTPFTSLTSSLDWTHNVNPITELLPSLQFQHLSYDNAAQSEVTFWRAMMGMQTQLSRRLKFKGSAGGAWLDSKQNSIAAANPAGLTSGSALDWLADMQLTYQPSHTVTVGLTASRSVGPTTLGQFLKTDSFGASLQYSINQVSNVALSGSFAHQTSATASAADILSASVAYSRRLTREWRSQLSYKFQQRDSDTGSAHSNAVLFSVTREATILP